MSLNRLLLTLLLAPIAIAQTQPQPQPKPQPKPANLRSILLEQLRSTHNKAEWFVPVNTAVAGLTPEQARWIPQSQAAKNPAPADHSVGMLANHLLFWNQQTLSRMKNPKAPAYNGSNEETFNKFDAASWTSTVQQLDQVLTDLEHLVETADDAHLQQWASPVAHIGAHNAYHTGQIILIRKLQGTWDPTKGVK